MAGLNHAAPISSTIYTGQHRFLPAESKLRDTWAERCPQDIHAGEAERPELRTEDSIYRLGMQAELKELTAKQAGYHCLSIFHKRLTYVDPTWLFYNDQMHLISNAGKSPSKLPAIVLLQLLCSQAAVSAYQKRRQSRIYQSTPTL